MPIPTTLSAPPDTTFSALNGFAPSVEDCLRYAVWLMLYADDVNRKAYSYDDSDVSKGVRIRQNRAEMDPATGAMNLKQQLVGVAIARGTWAYHTGKAGEKKITIGVMHFEANDSGWLNTDVDDPPLTPETRIGRITEILMRGTIFEEAQLIDPDRSHVVIDPYYSGRNLDGTYDPLQLVTLATKPPDVRPTDRRVYPNPRKPIRSEKDWWELDPVKDFAVAYGVLATYTIEISDRTNMRRGGA